MKSIALTVCLLALAVGGAYAALPTEEITLWANKAARTGERGWEGIEANPVPVLVALCTFLATILYHKLQGKSLRESVEVAATRVTVVPIPVPTLAPAATPADESAAVRKRAQARATRTQLVADQIGLENRSRKLPDEISNAKKEESRAKQSEQDAERSLNEKKAVHAAAIAKREALEREKARDDAELAAIAKEIKDLEKEI
jgi:hypothetical protein